MHVDLEAINRYVLTAILLFVALLYIALLCIGFSDFTKQVSRKERGKKRPRNRGVGRGPSKEKDSIWQ